MFRILVLGFDRFSDELHVSTYGVLGYPSQDLMGLIEISAPERFQKRNKPRRPQGQA